MTEQQRESLERHQLNLEQAAQWYQVSERTIRRKIASGELKAHRVGNGRSIRIFSDDLDALVRPIPADAR